MAAITPANYEIPKVLPQKRLVEPNLNPMQLPKGQFPSAEAIKKYLSAYRITCEAPQESFVDNCIATYFNGRQITCLEIGSLISTLEEFLFKMSRVDITLEKCLPNARLIALALTKLASETLKVGLPFFPSKEEILKKMNSGNARSEMWASFFANKPVMPKFLIEHYFNILTPTFVSSESDTFMAVPEISTYLLDMDREHSEKRNELSESNKLILEDCNAQTIIQGLAQELVFKPQNVGFIPEGKINFPEASNNVEIENDKKLNASLQTASALAVLTAVCAKKTVKFSPPPSPPRNPMATISEVPPVPPSPPKTPPTKPSEVPPRKNSADAAPTPPKPPAPKAPSVPERSPPPPAPARRATDGPMERRLVLPSPHELIKSKLFNKQALSKTMPANFQ